MEQKQKATHFLRLSFTFDKLDEECKHRIIGAINDRVNEKKRKMIMHSGKSIDITWNKCEDIYWAVSKLDDVCVAYITTGMIRDIYNEVITSLQLKKSDFQCTMLVTKNLKSSK